MCAGKCTAVIEFGVLAAMGSLLFHHTSVTNLITSGMIKHEGNRGKHHYRAEPDVLQDHAQGVSALGTPGGHP